MTEWKEYKLGEIASFKTGKLNSNAAVENGIYPFFTCSPITYAINEYAYNQKAILLAGNNAEGNFSVKYYEGKFNAYQRTYIIESNKGICDLKFLYYSLKLCLQEFKHISQGTSTKFLTSVILNNFSISLPPLPEQFRIASILSSLDDKIDLLHRENKTLEAMAETLFRQWFIEEAKEDWKEGKLGNLIDETIGGEWGKENPEGDFIKPVQCIRGTDIADLSVGLATKTPIRYVKESKFEKIEPRNGDIIMEISGGTENQSTGRVAYVNDEVKTLFDYPIIFSNFCRLLRVKEEYTYFIYCYLKYLYDQDEFFNLENGSSRIKNLDYKTLLYEITYPMPNDKLQILDFNDNVSVYFEKINRNKKQIKTLTQQRDGLLPKLRSGEGKI